MRIVGALAVPVLLAMAIEARAVPPRTKSSPSPTGAWRIKRAVSQKDDSVTVTISLQASSAIHAWPGKVATPALIMRCKGGRSMPT